MLILETGVSLILEGAYPLFVRLINESELTWLFLELIIFVLSLWSFIHKRLLYLHFGAWKTLRMPIGRITEMSTDAIYG
jgi:hypothetical protein